MVTILITHANGFLGSHLIDLLLTKPGPIKIVGLYSPKTPTLKNLRHVKDLTKKVDLHEASCLHAVKIAKIVSETKPDFVFHFERFTRPGYAWKEPKDAFDLNVTGTQNLLQAVDPKTRVIIESSAVIYGSVPHTELPITETTPFYISDQSGLFEWSIVAQEAIVRRFILEKNLDVVIGRSFNIEGSRRRTGFASSDFASQIAKLEQAKTKNPVINVGNLAAKRDWTDVRDAARAFWLLAEKGKSGEVYNVGSGVIKSINEVLTALLSYSNLKRPKIEQDPKLTRPTDIPMLQADYSKLAKLGWEPKIPFGQMIQEILSDWRRRVAANEYDE